MRLWLMTSGFPYGSSELSFLAGEAPALARSFSLAVIPRDPKPEPVASAFTGLNVLPLSHASEVRHKAFALLGVLFDRDFHREARRILKSHSRIFTRLRAAVVFDAQARQLVRLLRGKVTDGILYSYWYDYGALAAVKLKREVPGLRVAVRTHGYELYDERTAEDWQPFKPLIDCELDCLIFAAHYAKKYYLRRYGLADSLKYPVCYLGSPTRTRIVPREDVLVIFSCSHLIPLKRVGLLAEGLALVERVRIEWHHIGDGLERGAVEQTARRLLDGKANVCYTLEGAATPEQLDELYVRYRPELFITTTESEGGCPVSLAEAAAQGLALIGTAAGGVPELVDDTNGILLPLHATAADVARAIEQYAAQSKETRSAMREASLEKWHAQFDADANGEAVAKLLAAL